MSVKYTSRVSEAKDLLFELQRAALKEVGKHVRKDAKARVPVDSGNLKKSIGTWVKRKGPEGPSLRLGVFSRRQAERKKLRDPYYGGWVEFGTVKMPPRPYMRPSVFENITQIRIILGQYLKHIEEENRARGLIDPEEEVADE